MRDHVRSCEIVRDWSAQSQNGMGVGGRWMGWVWVDGGLDGCGWTVDGMGVGGRWM